MTKRPVVWMLVSDASRARIFRYALGKQVRPQRLALVGSFEHPEGRAHTRDLITDAKGRKNGMGYDHRAGLDPRHSVKDDVAQRFARVLVKAIERGVSDHACDAIVLVAPPHFLGILKSALGDELMRRVRLLIVKEYTNLSDHEVKERLVELLAA